MLTLRLAVYTRSAGTNYVFRHQLGLWGTPNT